MTGKNLVLRSINIQDESRCVDIFRRPDGTFGFEEFRRDHEDKRGWFPIGGFAEKMFDNAEAALREARSKVVWLNDVIESEADVPS